MYSMSCQFCNKIICSTTLYKLIVKKTSHDTYEILLLVVSARTIRLLLTLALRGWHIFDEMSILGLISRRYGLYHAFINIGYFISERGRAYNGNYNIKE